MIQIRQSTFETNSSSAHSLILKPGFDFMSADDVYEELQWKLYEVEGKPGKFTLKMRIYDNDASFDRYPFRVLSRFYDKLLYLYAHAPIRVYPPTEKREWHRYQKQYYKVTNYIKKYLPWLDGVDWSYADEKPSSEAIGFDGALKKLHLTWYDYLFDRNVIVICDGDEYHVWKGMKKLGLVDMKTIKEEVVYD